MQQRAIVSSQPVEQTEDNTAKTHSQPVELTEAQLLQVMGGLGPNGGWDSIAAGPNGGW
jgi:hypothetical protein